MNSWYRISLIALLASFGQAAAQIGDPEQAAEELAPIPRYQVEVIVFAHANVGAGQEIFDHTAIHPDGLLVPLGSLDPEAISALALENPEPIDPALLVDDEDLTTNGEGEDTAFSFEPLLPEAFQLGNAAGTLERLGAYDVLGHVAWVQNGLGRDYAMPMNLQTLGVASPIGTVQLYRGRFLHIAVDLEYSPQGAVAPRLDAFGVPTFSGVPSYRLQTERNAIRSGELHYIDHPMFGLLVMVTPIEEMEDVTTDDTDVLEPAA